MKILFLTSRFPYPPYRGDKVRTYNFLKVLSEENEIHLVSFYESSEDLLNLKMLEPYCKNINLVYVPKLLSWTKALSYYFLSTPSQTAYYRSHRMERLIKKICRETDFDVAYVHLFRMNQYERFMPRNIFKIVDLTDVISKEIFRSVGIKTYWKTFFDKREATKIRNYEILLAKSADEIWVISEAEKEDLIRSSGVGNVHVVENGVPVSITERKSDNNSILFFGYSKSKHNMDALKFLLNNILPEVAKQVPGISLKIFGAGKWGGYKNTNRSFSVANLGFISNIDNIFSTAAVLVAPILYSAGTQNKILEAMSHGVPVVTSSFGNEGIRAEVGSQIIICDNPSSYVEQIVKILSNPQIGENIGKEGQKYVRSTFSWYLATKRMDEVKKLLNPPK